MEFIFKSSARQPFAAGRDDIELHGATAYFELDPEEETVDMGYRPSHESSVPEAVYNGRILRWHVDTRISTSQAKRLYKELEPLFQKVADGYSDYYDNGSHKGMMDAEAEQANEEIEERLRDFDAAIDVDENRPRRGRKPGIKSVNEEHRVVSRMVGLPRNIWREIDRQCKEEQITRSAYFRRMLERQK